MQLYRGMDVGTAKLPPAERQGVPHHLLDVLDVTEEASVAAYQRDARAALARRRVARPAAGAGRRVGAVRPRGARAAGDPADRPGGARPAGGRAGRGRRGGPARAARGGRPARRRRPSCPATAGGSCARWRSWRSPAGRSRRRMPAPGAAPAVPGVRLGLRLDRPVLDARIDRAGGADVRRRAGRPRRGRWWRPGCGRGGPRPAPSATPRCCACWRASGTRPRPAPTPPRATRRFARRQETWFRRDPADRVAAGGRAGPRSSGPWRPSRAGTAGRQPS